MPATGPDDLLEFVLGQSAGEPHAISGTNPVRGLLPPPALHWVDSFSDRTIPEPMYDFIRELNQQAEEREKQFRKWLQDRVGVDLDGRQDDTGTSSTPSSSPSVQPASSPSSPSDPGESTAEDAAGSAVPSDVAAHAAAADMLLRRALDALDDQPDAEDTDELVERIRGHLSAAPTYDVTSPASDAEMSHSGASGEPASSDAMVESDMSDNVFSEAPHESGTPLDATDDISQDDRSQDDGREDDTSHDDTADPLVALFIDWCHQESTMMSRYYMFERFLHKETGEEWRVVPVYRTLGGSDVHLSSRQEGSSDEFWKVDCAGQMWIVPQPRDDGSFGATDPVFDADEAVQPATLTDVRLPEVAQVDDESYHVRSKGTLR
jgi:hypothetical protein